MARLAGKTGWVKIGGVSYPFRSWRLRLSCSQIDVTGFDSNGFAEWLAGFLSGEVNAQGFADPALAITVGSTISMSLGAGGGYAMAFSGVVVDGTFSSAVDRAAEVELVAKTTGVFSPTLALGA